MIFKNKKDVYSLNIEDYINEIKRDYFRGVANIFCALPRCNNEDKKISASFFDKLLTECSVDNIIRIESKMREMISMEWVVDWGTLNIGDFVLDEMTDDQQRAVFVFASFNPNGYIREQAIKKLVEYKNSIPFILLRCNDWVGEVRKSAFDSLVRALKSATNEEIVYALAFAEKLSRNERCDYDSILEVFTKYFRGNDELIRAGLRSKEIKIRKFCISIISRLDNINYEYLMYYIKYERDPLLRKKLFNILVKGNNSGIDGIELSKIFINDKYPANRSLALEYLYYNNFKDIQDIARSMIMDKNAKVRSLACRIMLKYVAQSKIYEIYLENIDINPKVSICGLGEMGDKKDCRLIEQFLTDSRVSVIRSAMIALMRLDSDKYISCITEMLASEKSGIVKTATLLLKNNEIYDYERIYQIQSLSINENTKIKCASLLFANSKWKSIIYILRLIGSEYEKLDNLCMNQLNRWNASYNRSYTTLSDQDKKTILQLLDEKSESISPATLKYMLWLIK